MYNLIQYLNRSLSLYATYVIAFCLTAFNGQAFAQDTYQPDFNYEINQFFNTGSFLRSVDHATLWGSAGSAWVLEENESISEELAHYFNGFEWNGSKISFKTKFCSLHPERPRPLSLKGHIDFSQSNKYGGSNLPQRAILSTDQGAASNDLKGNCILISEISNYLHSRTMFKAEGSNVTIYIYTSDPTKALRLVYKPDFTFKPLARNLWKIRTDNGSPSCGLLVFSSGGAGSTSCCNFLGFEVKKSNETWFLKGGYEQTLKSCLGKKHNADGLMMTALSKGLKINDDGNLVAGAESDTPHIFDPVTGLEKAEGTWTLSGLEYRRFDSRIFTMPHVTKVHDETAIRELGVKLTVKPNELEIQAGCNSNNVKIDEIRRGFILMEKKSYFLSDICDPKEKISNILTRKLIAPVGGPVLKVDFDEHAQTLTLTRASIGAYARSHSWIFSR